MAGLIIAIIILSLVYVFLRSKGGEGATIRFQVPSFETEEGKKVRLQLIGIILLLTLAAIFVAFMSDLRKDQAFFMLFIFLAIAVFGVFVPRKHPTDNKKPKKRL